MSSRPNAESTSADEIFALMAGFDEPAADLAALFELEAISRAASVSVHKALAEQEIRDERVAVLADRVARRQHTRERADCFGYERFVPSEEDLISARRSFLSCAAESCEVISAIAAGSSLAVTITDYIDERSNFGAAASLGAEAEHNLSGRAQFELAQAASAPFRRGDAHCERDLNDSIREITVNPAECVRAGARIFERRAMPLNTGRVVGGSPLAPRVDLFREMVSNGKTRDAARERRRISHARAQVTSERALSICVRDVRDLADLDQLLAIKEARLESRVLSQWPRASAKALLSPRAAWE